MVLSFAVSAAEERSGGDKLSIAELITLVSEHGRIIRSFRIEGVVCSVVSQQRLIALQDDSATALLEVPAVEGTVHPGDRVAIEGQNCSLVRNGLSLQIGTAPVVDNDGRHSSILRSGKVFLPAGLQPVRLGWFNGVNDAVLNLEWEGPGVQRQKIPASILWNTTSGTNSATGRGLNFVACNGGGDVLADFYNQKPMATGVATNFDISYRVRSEHTALVFNGWLQTPRAGVYTFYLTSDDGAQVWVGKPAVSCTQLGHAPIPATKTLNQALARSDSPSWVELEGEVSFASANRRHLELELAAEGNRVPVKVIQGANLLSRNLLHEHIRVTGICEFSREQKKPGIVVPSTDQVEFLSQSEGFRNATNQLLTSVLEVRQLKPEQVPDGIPARIKGVVVGLAQASLMLQDSTGGISVHFDSQDWAECPRVGEFLEVEGVTGVGMFAPMITARHVRRLGTCPLPEPIRPGWDALMNASVDCEYVEIQGILLSASQQAMVLYTGDGRITVKGPQGHPLPQVPASTPEGTPFVGSLVRLRGCYTPEVDTVARQVVRGTFFLSPPFVNLEEAAPKDLFSQPVRKVTELLWNARASALERVKLRGQIIHAQPGEYLALEGQRGFRVLTAKPFDLKAGDFIEAVGFPKLEGPSPTLQEAQVRRIGHGSLPAPVPVSSQELLDRNHDATLVQVEGTLVGETTRAKTHVLELQAGSRHFIAIKEFGTDLWPKLTVGTELKLVGAYASANRANARTEPFTLFLIDSSEAITVLRRPSWWTPRHALIVASVLASALGMAFVWITLLRKKVEERTAQLREETLERQQVEQCRAVELERVRVARDLHDELGAGLTEVGILGELAKNPAILPEEKIRYLEQLTDSACALVTGLDEIVWAINPQYDSMGELASYCSMFAQRFLTLAGIRCRFQFAESFPKYPLEAKLRHGVFIAFKETLNNTVRHSGATEVGIKMQLVETSLEITISDNGRGLKAGENPPGSDGLSGMRQRLSELGGSCQFTSRPGEGTTVEFRLPLHRPEPNLAPSPN